MFAIYFILSFQYFSHCDVPHVLKVNKQNPYKVFCVSNIIFFFVFKAVLASFYTLIHLPPSDSTVSEDAGIEPRTVTTLALAVRLTDGLIPIETCSDTVPIFIRKTIGAILFCFQSPLPPQPPRQCFVPLCEGTTVLVMSLSCLSSL